MRNRFSTSLTALLLAALMLGGIFFTPATALAARSGAKSAGAFLSELSTGQFVVGRDSNNFPHTGSSFPNKYLLDKPYQDVLFKMVKQKEYSRLLQKMADSWSGSCYGVSGTMVLNYLTQYKGIKSLSAAQMQPGAKDYFDLGAPKYNRTALNYIHFYQLSWFASASRNGAETSSYYVRNKKTGRMQYSNLNKMAQAAMAFVNAGKPFQFYYSYPAKDETGKPVTKAHAIVGCDYYIDRVNQWFYLKFYDENDCGTARYYKSRPHFHYIPLKIRYNEQKTAFWVEAPKDTKGREGIFLYRYDYVSKKYKPLHLKAMHVVNAQTVYNNLKSRLSTSSPVLFSAASGSMPSGLAPELTLYDIDNAYAPYRIKPFVYKNDLSGDVTYADSCGRLYKADPSDLIPPDVNDIPDDLIDIDDSFIESSELSDFDDDDIPVLPPEPVDEPMEPMDYPPIPVDEIDEDLPFGNMAGFDKEYDPDYDEDDFGYRYETYEDEEGGLDIVIDLLQEGNVGGSKRSYDGYDIENPSGDSLSGVSLEYGGSFASVGGAGIELVRFSSDGRLRDVKAGENGNGSLELYFGTENEISGLDMFRMGLESFGFLQVYDTQDDPDYANCIVLRTDGLVNGFDFTFYKDALVSDDYEGYSTDGSDVGTWWIKIQAAKTPSGELGATVWTEKDDGGGNLPSFKEPPIFTEELHERPDVPDYPSGGGSDSIGNGGSEYIPAVRQTLYSQDSEVSLSGTTISAGDALIAQPLTSGADYNFMLGLAGNNEVVKLYDIHLASGQSALGGGAELCFALGARYANEAFTLVHKKADGSVEYFYARADENGTVRFTGICSLSPFMLVKGRLSAVAVTTTVAEVPATGSAPLLALLGVGLLLAAITSRRSKRKYTDK